MKFTVSPKVMLSTLMLVLLASGWCSGDATSTAASASAASVPSAATVSSKPASPTVTTTKSANSASTPTKPPVLNSAQTTAKSSAPGVASVSLLTMCGALMTLMTMSA